MPHQVAYEYQKERLNIISQQLEPYSELQKSLDNHLEKFQEILKKYSNRHSFSDFVDIKQISGTVERAYKRVKKVLVDSQSNYPNLLDQDDFRERLTNLFDDKVGKPYSDEELVKVYKEAEKRFKDSLPPGYMDARGNNKKDAPECYGDVVIWFQLIDYAKEQKKPLIFVTDDQKEDWWLKSQGKSLGPRPELIQEILMRANVSFYLYTGDRFLDQAGDFLNLSSEPAVIEEAKDIRSKNEVQHFGSLNGTLQFLPTVDDQDGLLSEQISKRARQSYQNYLRAQQTAVELMQNAFDPRDRFRAREMLLQAQQQLQRDSTHIREMLLRAEQELKDLL